MAARFLAKRNVSGVHFLTSEKEITELVWLLRASGIRVLHDTDVAALVDIHLEVHKELRAAMVARAKLTRVENVEEGVEKIMPVKAPVRGRRDMHALHAGSWHASGAQTAEHVRVGGPTQDPHESRPRWEAKLHAWLGSEALGRPCSGFLLGSGGHSNALACL